MHNAGPELATIETACGVMARQVTATRLGAVGAAEIERLQRNLAGEADPLRRAWLTMEALLSTSNVRTLWPHTDVTPVDLRNRFRSVSPQHGVASAGGWGFDKTFNPKANSGATLPMLVHSFGLNKAVPIGDQGWLPYRVAAGFGGDMTCRPALRSLADPTQTANLVLSCSLISTPKCSTTMPVGFVLNAPVWNIFGFAPKDIQFANDTARTMTPIDQARGITAGPNNLTLTDALRRYPTLASLVSATNNRGGDVHYNEIVVVGTSKLHGSKVAVTGIFVKIARHMGADYVVDTAIRMDDDDEYNSQTCFYHDGLDGDVATAIRACSLNRDIPLVPIRDDTMVDRRSTITWNQLSAGRTVRNGWNCTLA